jgi:hypothetical protein
MNRQDAKSAKEEELGRLLRSGFDRTAATEKKLNII